MARIFVWRNDSSRPLEPILFSSESKWQSVEYEIESDAEYNVKVEFLRNNVMANITLGWTEPHLHAWDDCGGEPCRLIRVEDLMLDIGYNESPLPPLVFYAELPLARPTRPESIHRSKLLAARPPHHRFTPDPVPPGGNKPLIVALCLSTCTRGKEITHLEEIPLIGNLWPTFALSAEPEYEYWISVAYDLDDPFDFERRLDEIQAYWDSVIVPLLEKNRRRYYSFNKTTDESKFPKIVAKFRLLPFDNPSHKPGPAFNYACRAAAEDGADYFYRVNDDTELEQGYWTTHFIALLKQLCPPNVGVTGPTARMGQGDILTHDFTHRTHQVLFESYYPEELTDWWLDTWITRIYEDGRLIFTEFLVSHLAETRYEVSWERMELVNGLVDKGKAVVRQFLLYVQ